MPYDFPKLSSAVTSPFSENTAKLAALFPSVIKDGKLDLDELRAQLGEFDEVGREKYGLTWAGKSDAQKKTGEALVGKTLKYIKADSKNPETTQNIYIEGDNLEALKLLQNAYRGKIKMIYIDPPYNTGNDFVYNDTFTESADEAAVREGNAAVVDGKFKRYTVNTKTNGRYHATWLSMMYPRLQLARNLLSEDGVIFISIGNDELSNIKSLCDEIFGEENLLGIISRQMKAGGGNQGKYFTHNIDYICVYAHQYLSTRLFKTELSENVVNSVYNQIETSGDRKGERYRLMGLYQASLGEYRPNQKYFIKCPDGSEVLPPCSIQDEIMREGDGRWRWSINRFVTELEANNIEFKETTTSPLVNKDGSKAKWNVYTKIWLKDREDEGQVPSDLILKYENRHSSKELQALKIPFDFAKPMELIKYLISILNQERDISVMDFFSGSATTAHAVMQLNAEDGGNRKFILVQLPESCDEKSEAYKAGYKNICEIGKERIRRAGDKIKAEHPLAKIDTGFKVFRVDDTNIKWIARELAGNLTITAETTTRTEQKTLEDTFCETQNTEQNKDNIDFMPKTNDIDIVYEILLHQYDIPLTVDIEKCEQIGNRTYEAAAAIIICLEETITPEIIEKIAAVEPVPKKIFFRDSAFNDDISLKENAMLRLDALMQMHLTADAKGMKGRLPYSVEFL